jgi:2'-5' RNA ligase
MQLAHYFLAVPLNKDCQQWLSTWQDDLKQKLSYKIWPHPLDLHITLKFLGPVSKEDLDKLKESLKKQETMSPFFVTIGTLGTFGNPRKPRVLWAGVKESKQLSELKKTAEDVCVSLGFKPENRPYRPHITLGKKWEQQQGEETIFDLEKFFQEEMQMAVDRFVVYQINPSRSPKYEVVQEIYLC